MSIHITSTPKSPVLLDSLHFLQHRRRLSSAPAPSPSPSPAPAIKFPRPADIVILWKQDQVERAIQKVQDGLLPAVFYFASQICVDSNLFGSPTVRKMREEFPHPHVTVYKYVHTFEDDLLGMNVMFTPTFHFYQNGKKVDEIFANPYQNRTADEIPDLVMEICEKLYRHVIQVETTQPMSSFGKGKGKRKRRTYQQLFVQAKTDENENDKVVALGGGKVGGALAFAEQRGGAQLSQRRGAAASSEHSDRPIEAVDSSGSAPSFDEAMKAVVSIHEWRHEKYLRWYAKGLFKANPEKKAMCLKVVTDYKIAWLLSDAAED
ncbi:hypothetical protein FF1_005364 [Malus domestica]